MPRPTETPFRGRLISPQSTREDRRPPEGGELARTGSAAGDVRGLNAGILRPRDPLDPLRCIRCVTQPARRSPSHKKHPSLAVETRRMSCPGGKR